MGISSSKKKDEHKIQNCKEKNNESNEIQIDKIYKIILILIAQQKEFKKNKDYEELRFFLINETFEKYDDIFNINDILNFYKDFLLEMNSLEENFESEINTIKKYSEKNQYKSKVTSHKELEYNSYFGIQCPSNFSLIKRNNFLNFINVFEEYNNIDNLYEGAVFNDYFLIKRNKKEEKWDYLIYSLNERIFIINFIIILNEDKKKDLKSQKLFLLIKEVLEKQNFDKKKNEKVVFNDGNEDIGSIICFPEIDNKKEEEDNNKILNKIKYYFNLDEKYKYFLTSMDKIKNNKINSIENGDEIEKLVNSQKKSLSENQVYAIDEDRFKEIKNRIYFYEFIIYLENNNNGKEIIINNIVKKEKNIKINLEDILIKSILSLDNCITNCKNKKNICLINEDFYKNVINKASNEKQDCLINLLKINQQYFLYFNKNKILFEINEQNNTNFKDKNIWSINLVNKKNIDSQIIFNPNDNNDIKNNEINIEEKKKLIIPVNIVKNLLLIYNQSFEICQKNKENSYMKNMTLINKKWLQNYKDHFNLLTILRKTKIDINIIKNEKYEACKLYLENKINENILSNIETDFNSEFREEFKNSKSLYPEMNSNFECPINFDIIDSDLFKILIKENNKNYEQKINFNELNNNYNIVFEGKILIIKSTKKDNTLFAFSIIENPEDSIEKNYEIKYIFQFINSSIPNNEINYIINNPSIDKYISSLKLDLSYSNQNIIKENKIIGQFININPLKFDISSFQEPPLIGLVNVGATCYMNATLQSFSNIGLLTNFFLTRKNIFIENGKKYDLAKEYSKLIMNLWNKNINPKNKFYEPNDFKKKIGEKNPLFSGIAANDSKDLILFILEELHKELNKANKANNNDSTQISSNLEIQISNQTDEKEEYKKFKEGYYSQNKSIIQKIFYGEQESFTLCHSCKVKIYSFSIINFLIFPLEKVRRFLINNCSFNLGFVTLLDCFQHYICPEVMRGENQMYCNNCKKSSDFSMCNKIFKHPKVLIIILNRGKGLEFQVPFQYPISFFLNNYININCNNSNYIGNEIIEYELISVITHIGDNSMSGHFIACCKSPVNGKWYCYNDAIVSECKDPINIFGPNSTNSIPYVLFYQIKNNNNMGLLLDNKTEYKDNNTTTILNTKVINENVIVILYFLYNGKELFIDVKEKMIFEEVIKELFEKYNYLKGQYTYQMENGKAINLKKSIKENGIKSESKILMIKK